MALYWRVTSMTTDLNRFPLQTCGAEVSHARISHLQTKENERVLTGIEADSSSDLPNFSGQGDLAGFLLRMFPDFLTVQTERISGPSSRRWMNSGMAYRGEYWTQSTSEHPNAVEESTLSEVLEASAPLEYFLNRKELQSLLDRAVARGKPLPACLERVIRAQMSLLSNTLPLDESHRPDPRRKDIGMTEKPIPLIQEGPLTLYVRRMMPSECEKLQGLPPGWTDVDSEA